MPAATWRRDARWRRPGAPNATDFEPTAPGASVADLTEVANLPSTTALSLKVFLQSSHKDMPNLILKPAEADDIIAYILSLKRR